MNVFLSQPMRGRSNEEIAAERAEILKDIRQTFPEAKFTDSFFGIQCGFSPLECLGEALKLLAKADCAYFVDGWEDTRGCRIEHQCCVDYGIKILYDGRYLHD